MLRRHDACRDRLQQQQCHRRAVQRAEALAHGMIVGNANQIREPLGMPVHEMDIDGNMLPVG